MIVVDVIALVVGVATLGYLALALIDPGRF